MEENEKEDDRNTRWTAYGLTKTQDFIHSGTITNSDMEKRVSYFRDKS